MPLKVLHYSLMEKLVFSLCQGFWHSAVQKSLRIKATRSDFARKKKGDCVNFSHGDSRSQKLHRLLKIKFDASCLIILFPARENKINAGVGQWIFFFFKVQQSKEIHGSNFGGESCSL